MLFVLEPIAYIQLPFHIVVLSFALLHSLKEVSFVLLRVGVLHLPPAVRAVLENFPFVESPIGQFQLCGKAYCL